MLAYKKPNIVTDFCLFEQPLLFEKGYVEMRHYWTRIRFKYGFASNSIADKVKVSANISAEIISDLIDNVEKGSDSFSNSDTEYILEEEEETSDETFCKREKEMTKGKRRNKKGQDKRKANRKGEKRKSGNSVSEIESDIGKEKGKGKQQGGKKKKDGFYSEGNKKGLSKEKGRHKGDKRRRDNSDSEFEAIEGKEKEEERCSVSESNINAESGSESGNKKGLSKRKGRHKGEKRRRDNSDSEFEAVEGKEKEEERYSVSESDINAESGSESDFSPSDDEEYTRLRRISKQERYRNRFFLEKEICPSTLEHNMLVIEKFKDYLRIRFSLTSWDRVSSTYRLSIGYLFTYKDSLLQYQLKKDPTFKLEQYIQFRHEDFRELEDPTDWIMILAGSTGKDNPDDRVEMDKAWKRFNLFVRDQLEKSKPKYNEDIAELLRYRYVIENIDDLYKITDRKKITAAAKVMSNIQKRERENAEEYVKPNKRLAEKDTTKNWFSSDAFKEELDDFNKVWNDMMCEKVEFEKKRFNRLGMFAKFHLMLISKNRPSVFNFTQNQYDMKQELWITDANSSNYEFLSTDYPSKPPTDNPNMRPNCWIIKLSGGTPGIKGQKAQVIFVNNFIKGILEKYCDLKGVLLKKMLGPQSDSVEEGNRPFFINFDLNPLNMPYTRGSIWTKFSSESGLESVTMTSIRRELEHKVQSSPVARSRIEDIQSHSKDTGSAAYDKTSPFYRAIFMNGVSQEDASNIQVDDSELPKNIQDIRAEREIIQRQRCQETVKLAREKKDSRRKITNTTRLLPDDRIFIKELFLDQNYPDIYNAVKSIFPQVPELKRLFYRLVDGPNEIMTNEVKDKLKEVEQRIFLTVKEIIEKQYKKAWQEDCKEMNYAADKGIVTIIRKSFYYNDRNKKLGEKPDFVFSRKKIDVKKSIVKNKSSQS